MRDSTNNSQVIKNMSSIIDPAGNTILFMRVRNKTKNTGQQKNSPCFLNLIS